MKNVNDGTPHGERRSLLKRLALTISMVMFGVVASAQAPKPPAEMQARILKVLLDQSNLKGQMGQLQTAYQSIQTSLQHDQQELDSLKAEALKEAGKAPAEWDLDLDKLEFVAKPSAKPASNAKSN